MNLPRKRNWSFVAGIRSASLADTDFWVEPGCESDGRLTFTLHGVSELADPAQNAYARRTAIEDRLTALNRLANRTGTLQIDVDTPRARSYGRVTLDSVKLGSSGSSAVVSYDLAYSETVAYGAPARSLVLVPPENHSARVILADTCVVKFAKPERASYQEVWRGPLVRIAGGPACEEIEITGIRENRSAIDPAARRRALEMLIRDMQDWIGRPWMLSVDGAYRATAYLLEVSPSRLDLPDALVYDLKFKSGIIEG